jgi:inner membrane protein
MEYMTARTHDLAAFTALNIAFLTYPQISLNAATLLVSVGANFIGGLAPDLDNSSTQLWKQFRGGPILAKILSPLLGGHRLISHSLLGLALAGLVSRLVLNAISPFLIVDMQIVWSAFMIGYASHLFMDFITKEGLPLLFPIPWNFGFPPFKFLRFKTGSITEKGIVFPGLMAFTFYLVYRNYAVYLALIQRIAKS